MALLAGLAGPAAETGPADAPVVLREIREIRALSPERAGEGLPLVVRGVVTRVTIYELFIQSGADAIFVWQEAGTQQLKTGDYVEITGKTHSGHLFPIVRSSGIRLLEHRELPVPRVMPYAELATGRGDCQWVEVAGIVESVERKPDGTFTLRLSFDGALLRIELGRLEPPAAARLLGAHLRLRGVVSGFKSPQRKLVEPVVVVSGDPGTVWIERPGPEDVFAVPLQSTGTLGGADSSTPVQELVRISGVVTCQPNPLLVFVRDQAQSLEIRLAEAASLKPGDRIDAVGFATMGIIQPVLKNALVRRLGSAEAPPPRALADAAQLLDLQNEAELVEVGGELRDISRNRDGYALVVADKGRAFNVTVDARFVPTEMALPPVGSRVSLVGICQIDRVTPPDLNQVVAPASVRLYLRSPGELRVLSRPSWWTPQRLLALVAVLGVLSVCAAGWILTLNRRVQAQTRIILANARRQATLEERNRIAREFHDTLEQQLAGATIMLDAVDTVVLDQPQLARDSLQTTRAMLRHSLDEAQQAVANLRNNDLFERDFSPLLEDAVHERTAAAGLQVEFLHEGAWPGLDPRIKQHLLRIVQESVTNTVKHARAGRVTVAMRALPDRLELSVSDDGCGFNPQDHTRHGRGEFGLIGLLERAEKIGARLAIHSAPQQGTTVTITLPPAGAAPTI